MTSTYGVIAELVSKIRNARFGDMVEHLEELIDSGDWHDFTVPIGFRFQFLECEFDYFLLAENLDPTTVRTAYIKAASVTQVNRLADITGRGVTGEGQRRSRDDMAKALVSETSGAAARIQAGGQFVTASASRIAKSQELRRDAEAGKVVKREHRKRWEVRWLGDRSPAQAITDELLTEPELAHDVYKRLHSWSVGNAAKEKRRSGVENGSLSAPHEQENVNGVR
jgi:hypothetical protein